MIRVFFMAVTLAVAATGCNALPVPEQINLSEKSDPEWRVAPLPGGSSVTAANAAAEATLYVVTVKDGSRLEGRLVTREPGKYVVMDLPNGERRTINWAAIASQGAGNALPPPDPASPAGRRGRVTLNDGSRVDGVIVKQEPGQYVIVRKADGSEATLNWSTVKQIELAPEGAP